MTANLTLETCVDRKVRTANKGFSTGGVPCSADTFVQDGSDDMIFSMTEDHKGNIWFATRDHGICTYDGISFTTIGRNEGLDIRGATAILQDETNGFWITTFDNGIWYYDGATGTHFTESNGLVNNAVMSLLKDKDGNVWFGTKWFGLSRYDGKTFTTFSQ